MRSASSCCSPSMSRSICGSTTSSCTDARSRSEGAGRFPALAPASGRGRRKPWRRMKDPRRVGVLGQRGMDELRESSLLFSLEGLLETERERVQREAREAQKRRDEEMIRVAEQASRLRLASQQEREARERRLALEQERERLEQERIE